MIYILLNGYVQCKCHQKQHVALNFNINCILFKITARQNTEILYENNRRMTWGGTCVFPFSHFNRLCLLMTPCILSLVVFRTCVAVVKCRIVLHRCKITGFWSYGIMSCMLFIFDNRVPLMR